MLCDHHSVAKLCDRPKGKLCTPKTSLTSPHSLPLSITLILSVCLYEFGLDASHKCIVQHLFFCVHEHRESFHLFRPSLIFFFQQCFVVFAVQVFHFFGRIYSYFIQLDAIRNGTALHAHSSCIRTASRSLILYLRPSQLDLSGASKLHFSLCPLPTRVSQGLFFLHIRWFPSAGNQSA